MLVVLCIAAIALLSEAAQTVAVRGVLMCGNETLADVEIKLFDNHRCA